MSFESNLRAVLESLNAAQREAWRSDEEARKVVAFHGPYLLRRFADMSVAFDASAPRSDQSAIFARRDAQGYHTVEFVANDLHIVLEVVDGGAHLFWLAGDMTDDLPITMETPSAVIDRMLIDAVSAYARRVGDKLTSMHHMTTKEARHA